MLATQSFDQWPQAPLNQSFEAGDHFVAWDATDNSGQQVASGMYVYMFTAGKYQKTEKMLLLK